MQTTHSLDMDQLHGKIGWGKGVPGGKKAKSKSNDGKSFLQAVFGDWCLVSGRGNMFGWLGY